MNAFGKHTPWSLRDNSTTTEALTALTNSMFTGLIEHVGKIANITPTSDTSGFFFRINDAAPILSDCHVGDSICVNGACLTVTEFGDDWFDVNLANETLRRTNLGALKEGDNVNCERAMSGHTRFGGHMVQGHVDTTATILSVTPDGDSLRYVFQLDEDSVSYLPFIVEKGYVTIDGASLTVTQVDDAGRTFGIMLISHSQTKVTLSGKQAGDKVNVEVDCVGKYVLGSESRIEAIVERIVDRRLQERGL